MDLRERKERVFIALCALFFGSMTLLNVVGLTRFIQLGPLALAVGVLPYPLTFLVTDIISEFYGRSRANFVVWVGLGLNLFVLTILYLGQLLPPVPLAAQPPWQIIDLAKGVPLPNGDVLKGEVPLFYLIYGCASGSIAASMLAYVSAQFVDVQIFHYLKEKTNGKALWLRNNLSTLCSQFIDSVAVIGITFGLQFIQGNISVHQLGVLLASNYLFKMSAALLDTLPFYFIVAKLHQYFGDELSES